MDPISLFLYGLAAAALGNLWYQIEKEDEKKKEQARLAEEKKRERRAGLLANIVISVATGFLVMAIGYFAFGVK